jgi:hypothetical protein
VTVLFEPSAWDPHGIDKPPPDLANLVRVTRGVPFLDAWNREVGTRRERRPFEAEVLATPGMGVATSQQEASA